MGFSGIGMTELLLILLVVVLLFGTSKLRNIGGDLGGAVRSFKQGIAGGAAENDRDERERESVEGSRKTLGDDIDIDDSNRHKI